MDVNVTLDKAIRPLIVAGIAALLALLGGQVVDLAPLYAAMVTAASGLLAMGVTYAIKYSQTRPNKALAAALPLLVAVLQALTTGEIDGAAILLGAQGVVGFIWTYVAPRTGVEEVPTANARNN